MTGALIGAFTVLPDSAEMTPALPLPPDPPDPPEPAMTVLLAAPPRQAALAKPTTAAAMPQTLTGALIGAFTVLPDSAEMTPALPLPPGPPDPPEPR